MNTKFFTGQGDAGESSVGPKKLSKSDPLIDLLGGVDELNSWIGFSKTEAQKRIADEEIDAAAILKNVQESLFIIQAELAALGFGEIPGKPSGPKIREAQTKELERTIETIDAKLPPLKSFVIPGGSELGARLDIARTAARKVERRAKKYGDEKGLPLALLQYLNRLSSLLFALARYANYVQGVPEENPSYK
ncbi:MAG: ATP:cob(I)alamin adenosyltransferase [Candidatus Jorgensenbacteria bacterium GW2011_GWA1_48_11]|uniref:Corrinoid adenosyltransferase n=1 Tax=Candidatus Jorgensenbacteria bacterium GW2011_GWA1_48_11 TaxID=1618660 RepID=A0A0G1UBL4_9BACT|nr:MAG: ATP:cob(I)alamin adenosyltransferase [Candidatus Jorgensenbacteria bacterium GW2011_GWA1_48_11]KKW12002.1 MAG: ATP:cob(I)alamin adenosyltransferase [Candidatus Jorgensenbacteria bacterium GW2011_GWB1_49_9]